ncbi:MAG: hypothetical protein K0R54_4415 [Clostridiaceae bacterium]|jgi:protein-arginine kinase activator protein McsA|nr:hypothetical protein [Clostridiaceae bacterium]
MILINKECFNNEVNKNIDGELYKWYKLAMIDKISNKYSSNGEPSQNASEKNKKNYDINKDYIKNNIIPFLEKGKGIIDKELIEVLLAGDFIENLASLPEGQMNGKLDVHWTKIIGYYALAKFIFYDYKKLKDNIIEFAQKNKLKHEECIIQIENRLNAEITKFNSNHKKFKIILEMPKIEYKGLMKLNRENFIIKCMKIFEKIIGIELQGNMKFYSNSTGDINNIFDINNFNEMLSYFISYEMLEDEQRHIILNTLNVQVCPYCNRQYITSYKPSKNKNDKIDTLATADLDHFYPKAKFQLFSLSLYNFVPACQICNSRMKNDRPIEILYPYTECFGDEVKFEVIPMDKENESKDLFDLLYGKDDVLKSEKYKININMSRVSDDEKKSHIEGSIEMFQLEQVYQSHKEYAAEIIRTQAIYDNSVYDSVMNVLFNDENRNMNVNSILSHLDENTHEEFSENEKKRILYGINIEDRNQELKKPLTKLTRDILKL